jgi:hypothetical protein
MVDKTPMQNYQGVTVDALVAAAAPAEKVYRAEVNMTTGVATVFKNTTGATISYVSIGAGNIGTAPNAALFGGDYNVYVSATDKANVGDGEVPAVVSAKHTTSPAIVTFSRVDQFSGAVNGIIYVEIALY